MKKLIIKLSLIAILVVACNTASAVFIDSSNLQVLMHCDETTQDYWLITPDDNSSGRAVNECILDMAIDLSDIDPATEPTLMPDSPVGGSYFSFNGSNSTIYCEPGWLGGDSVVCDFTFRFRSPPDIPGFPFDGLASCQSFTCFLSTDGAPPHISLMVEQNYMVHSPITLHSNIWYHIGVTIVSNDVSITVNGSTFTETSPHPFPSYLTPLTMGCFLRGDFLAAGAGFLDGDMDEIAIGSIPEPFTFGFIGLLGLLAFRK